MCSRTRQKQVPNRSAISRPVKQWSHGEKLIQRQLSVKNVPSGEAVGVFQIPGCDDLMAQNKLRQFRSIQAQRLDQAIDERHELVLPIAFLYSLSDVLS